MPQISKIRIVNFYYNNGHRMIPDELYDLSDAEGKKALDTLISLINGGGKSVLVQLIMQPVLPKAKASGRKIESYFQRPGDHCYVVLEWVKDGSSEKLMTGISIAATQPEKIQDTDTQTARIKYYTFYANYSDYTGNCNIIDLPLSSNENGHFTAADFDEVRKLSRKNRSSLQVYSSDENLKWAEKLTEYGIFQEEWRHLMQPLNSVEGGMAEFFKGFKTSDALIDSLLIPAIETRLSGGQERWENSLATMLAGFVRQSRKQAVQLERRRLCERYLQDIQAQRTKVQSLWALNDQRDHTISDVFGFSAALQTEIGALEQNSRQIEDALHGIQEKSNRINFEEASEQYYRAASDAEKCAAALSQAQQERDALTQQRDETAHQLIVQQAARHWEKCRRYQSEIIALQEQIRTQERGESADQLNRVGASVRVLAGAALEDAKEKREQLQTGLMACQETLTQAKNAHTQAVSEERESKSALDRAETRCNDYCAETDKQLETLGISLMRGFTGNLPEEELQEHLHDAESALQTCRNNAAACEARLSEIGERVAAIPGELAKLEIQRNDLDRTHKDANNELQIYLDAEARMLEICELYSLQPESRFTDAVSSTLEQHRITTESDFRSADRHAQTLKEEIQAAQQGTLHVPQAVLNFLERAGIQPRTCEEYFLMQLQNGNLNAERLEAILAACPAAAYGIILEERERMLLDEQCPEWLPAAVPVFSMQDMSRILAGTSDPPAMLAQYAADYFMDQVRFLEKLQAESQQTDAEMERLRNHLQLLQEQIQTAEHFGYDAQWGSRQEQKLADLSAKMAVCEYAATQLNDEKTALISEKIEKEQQKASLDTDVTRAETNLSGVQAVLDRLPLEETHREARDAAQAQHDACVRALQTAEEQKQKADAELTKQQKAFDDNDTLCQRLLDALGKVELCTGDGVQQGDWQELLAQYETLLQSQKDSMQILLSKLQTARSNLDDAENELKRADCAPEEYQAVSYDATEENRLRNLKKQLERELTEKQRAFESALMKNSRADERLNNAHNALSPFGGEPLRQAEIAENFAERRRKLDAEQREIEQTQSRISEQLKAFQKIESKISVRLEQIPAPEHIPAVTLSEDPAAQWKKFYEAYTQITETLQKSHNALYDALRHMLSEYPDGAEHSALEEMLKMLQSPTGDVYYSLDSMMEQNLEVTGKYISKINSDLADFDNSRNDLVNACTKQGQLIWDGLRQMEKSAGVKLHENDARSTRLIRFDLPEQVDELTARERIRAELEQSVKELSDKLDSGTLTEPELEKAAGRVVSSSRLLRKYIQKEQIGLKALKIDSDASLRDYRTWESTAVDNSGAEKFLVYFAVILSVMHYTRSEDGISRQAMTGVLILDNPFGVITSQHVLEPMFRIARHFLVQLICLSDITKCDITACFSMHIKAKIKENKLSSVSLLTHEGNEQIEHGFYRASQMALL